ncbi:deacetylvindoline O-acetyltransferase-like [Olea europaea var. sylvestris]|uniref:deacetylvindoline O-acetyltransferase-like n=1 Tax=Olea europaea var. sylvestris TaxID=158386 RepID=UPI000C1D670C|nr:deacetylvindoline O-acetyltransferase-like [Olea europaea var. sylvestris]
MCSLIGIVSTFENTTEDFEVIITIKRRTTAQSSELMLLHKAKMLRVVVVESSEKVSLSTAMMEESLLLWPKLKLSWAPPGTNVLKIQANHFDCGGMVIGLTGSHAVAGGITICSFLKAWAATAAGVLTFIEAQCPNYIAPSLFPPNDKIAEESLDVFDSSAISTLKAKSLGSRVQVMTALIWKCFMAACAAANNLPSLMVHAVDLRSRAVPPFSENCFGNFLYIAAAAA